jgi:hypothetical protein
VKALVVTPRRQAERVSELAAGGAS